MKAHHDKMGSDLLMAMRDSVCASYEKALLKSFRGEGVWLMESDLDAKYNNDPTILAAIKRNARRLVCPVKEVELIEDLSYKSVQLREEHLKELIKKICTQDSKSKKVKVAKAPKPATIEEVDGEKPISKKHDGR